MGRTTQFEGTLKFTKLLTAEEELHLQTFLGKDGRDHPEWLRPAKGENLSYIDFEINKDKSGIEWDGAEKSYDMVDKVNLLLLNMKAKFSDFGLQGSLRAQGEENGDIWDLAIVDGEAVESTPPKVGDPICCPYCHKVFKLES